MGKFTYESDIVAMALLYRKKYAGTDMISYDKIKRFDEVINKNLDDMEANCGISLRDEVPSELYFVASSEKKERYAIMNPDADLKKAWEYHVGCLPIDIMIASLMDNALVEIGLISVDDKIIDRNSYYNELANKYNLLSEFTRPKFDVFRDWESVSEDSFVFKYCISDAEQLIVKELKANKKVNDDESQRHISVLKKSRKK